MNTDPKNLQKHALAASDSFSTILGPSFKVGLPSAVAWAAFLQEIKNPIALTVTELWYEKFQIENKIPLRKTFRFDELAPLGPNLILYKQTEDSRWLTTFCGTRIVDVLGKELTGKYLEDYSNEKSLQLWRKNIEILVTDDVPILEYYNLDFVEKKYVRTTSINLPLRSGKQDFTDMLLEITTFGPR